MLAARCSWVVALVAACGEPQTPQEHLMELEARAEIQCGSGLDVTCLSVERSFETYTSCVQNALEAGQSAKLSTFRRVSFDAKEYDAYIAIDQRIWHFSASLHPLGDIWDEESECRGPIHDVPPATGTCHYIVLDCN